MRTINIKNQEDGFAAIVIAIVLVLVLGLTTVGFAQLMNKEQRQALDKQLSSQAYYAAESGVNDAVKAINAGFLQEKSDCGPLTDLTVAGAKFLANNKIGGVNNSTSASYPCLLINPTPSTLEYNSVDTGTSRVFQIEGRDKNTNDKEVINKISISWEDPNDSTSFAPNCNNLYPAAGGSPKWDFTGMLRVQLIPTSSSFMNRDMLAKYSPTIFLCPNAGSGTPGSAKFIDVTGSSRSGLIVNGNCSVDAKPGQPRYCNAEIRNVAIIGSKSFFMVLRSIYSPTRVTIRAYQAGGGGAPVDSQLNIAQAQTLVDSTGKAHDVLRRIQVRVPSHNSFAIPDGTSASICKQLSIWPDEGGSSNACPLP